MLRHVFSGEAFPELFIWSRRPSTTLCLLIFVHPVPGEISPVQNASSRLLYHMPFILTVPSGKSGSSYCERHFQAEVSLLILIVLSKIQPADKQAVQLAL